MNDLVDQKEREKALNIEESFIVQAPAGSGKTELLVQRFLKLLSYVNYPEEILAFTFTRKAANEMLERVIQALKNIGSLQNVCTRELAEKVLHRDQALNWNLLENLHRLRIQTMDSFCSYLIKSQLDIAEQPENFYREAAHSLLFQLETLETDTANLLEKILLHLNNDFVAAEKLFISMLSQRDQWLPHIITAKNNKIQLRAYLNLVLQTLGDAAAKRCVENFPQHLITELLVLFNFVTQKSLTMLPDDSESWKKIAMFLLTQEFEWRKMVDKRNGFPAHEKMYKKRMLSLLQQLSTYEQCKENLINILNCPEQNYTDNEWYIIEAVIETLPILVAELMLVFSEFKKVDYIHISTLALNALGEMENPSDLALKLDFQIKHILIDEFQDTSAMQLRLIEYLTAGWQPFDGRTLFLVGDPMQSIYRFRKADVGIFLAARHKGINSVALTALNLKVNFRSNESVIDWLNRTFAYIFPKQENISEAAVCFNPCFAFNQAEKNSSVTLHPLINASRRTQALTIVKWLQYHQQKNSQDNIAILIRQRSDLQELISLLKEYAIPFHGQELDAMADNLVVQDLLSLTRALMHPADRIAWLAILRAPWCGIMLPDLYLIANYDKDDTIYAILNKILPLKMLSNDAQLRVERCFTILQHFLLSRERMSLSFYIKSAWLELNGLACVQDVNQLQYAEAFFDLLDEYDKQVDADLILWLETRLNQRFLNIGTENSKIEIMTIHKAKGLEFDIVILPFLEKTSRNDPNKLMLWEEFTQINGNIDFMLAPMQSSYKENNSSVYNYLKKLANKKAHYELQRLLYVAATRTKKELHLFATAEQNADGTLVQPRSNSFLELLWPLVKHEFEGVNEKQELPEQEKPVNRLVRLISQCYQPTPDLHK